MAGASYPLSVIIKAVDNVTAPLRRINDRIRAATAPIRDLGARLGALSKEAGIPQLGAALAGVGRATKNVTSEILGLGKRLAIWAAIGTAGVAALVATSANAGDLLAKTADRVGLTIDQFAEMEFVAGRAGVSTKQFSTAMDGFNRRLGEFRVRRGSMYEFLRQVAPGLAQTMLRTAGTADALDAMLVALAKVTDPSKRAALSMQAFGKSGLVMSNLLTNGIGEIAELRQEFRRLVGSQEAFARNSEPMNDAMGDFQAAIMGSRNAIMGQLFPSLTRLTQAFTELVVDQRGRSRMWVTQLAASIDKFATDLPDHVRSLKKWFGEMKASLQPAADFFGGFPQLLGAVTAAIVGGPLLMSILMLTGAVAKLGLVMLTTPIGWFLLALGTIAGAVLLIRKNWDGIGEWWDGLWNDFGGVVFTAVQNIRNALVGMVPDWIAGLIGFDNRPQFGLPGHFGPALPADRARPQQRGAGGSMDVGGTLKIEIDADGRPRVREMRTNSPAMQLDVYSGPILIVP